MALPRFEKLPAERRQKVIAAAAMEFAAKGYRGAALGAIADNAEMGKTSFYYYFADKADLCATVLKEAWRQIGAGRRVELATLTAETFWPTVAEVAAENLELCRRQPWLLAASKFLNRLAQTPTGADVLDEYREKRREWETAFIARGQELGTVRTDVPGELLVTISLGVRQSSNLWLLERMEKLGAEECNALALHVFEIYRALLSPPPAWDAHPAEEPRPAHARTARRS